MIACRIAGPRCWELLVGQHAPQQRHSKLLRSRGEVVRQLCRGLRLQGARPAENPTMLRVNTPRLTGKGSRTHLRPWGIIRPESRPRLVTTRDPKKTGGKRKSKKIRTIP